LILLDFRYGIAYVTLDFMRSEGRKPRSDLARLSLIFAFFAMVLLDLMYSEGRKPRSDLP
jgi:hypothetical protein